MLFAIIWDSFLSQASALLLFEYAAEWVCVWGGGGGGAGRARPFKDFHKFLRNWFGLNNLCEILSQNLWKLGK